jgi:hypothetical protein
MKRPEMNLLLCASRLVRAALLLGAAATPALAQNPPGGYIDPASVSRGGDGVGGIEKNGGKAPKPTNPGNGGPLTDLDPAAAPSPSEGWNNLGGELPGAEIPVLTGNGDGSAGSSLGLELSSARPIAPTTLIVGADAAFQPFKGGVLVPTPAFVMPGLLTDELGTLRLETVLPGALPTGFTLVFQLWIQDPDGPQGFAASNGQLLLVP